MLTPTEDVRKGVFCIIKKEGEAVLKACQYCGRIHAKDYDCGQKPKKIYKNYKKNTDPSQADRFRWCGAWKRKVEQIKQRDIYLCRACLAELEGTDRKYNGNDLSVHHIEPLEEAYDLRLMDSNLITLCSMHHRQAEDGSIDKATLKRLAAEAPTEP
ncbi:HNH endonuclease [Ihubacter massiliensis]|uniref:HNH endonuclease n=1 Tax=Ihubacter massiliensis TaxID=1852367 RepID=UPI0020968B7E|nr:HNH endonuclease [Ihubacter massiliensis]MCI7301310.1 HNH endonuclease [Clostridia bacterium]MCO7120582.1 HNH endonuclease [Ihubacter massiliensis]MDY3010610.1 HNH endonuclease [Clostridiales Family XIII bacterium]